MQNNVQTAVTVEGNMIGPRQLIRHAETVQSNFIYMADVTARVVSRRVTVPPDKPPHQWQG